MISSWQKVGRMTIQLLSFTFIASAIWHSPAGDCLAASTAPHSGWQLIAEDRHKSVMMSCYSEAISPEQQQIIRLAHIAKSGKQRQQGAKKFNVRSYSQHQEEYLLDCSVMLYTLKKTMVFDGKRQLISAVEPPASQEVIIPGTELDMAAQKVCPNNAPSASEDPDPDPTLETSKPENHLSREEKQRIDALSAQAAEKPQDPKNWGMLGHAYHEAEMPGEAIKAYDRALQITPDSTEILLDQGAAYRKAGKPEQALLVFDRALRLAPDNLEALYNKGYIMAIIQNRNEEGFAVWKRYLELDNHSETARQLKEFMSSYAPSAKGIPETGRQINKDDVSSKHLRP